MSKYLVRHDDRFGEPSQSVIVSASSSSNAIKQAINAYVNRQSDRAEWNPNYLSSMSRYATAELISGTSKKPKKMAKKRSVTKKKTSTKKPLSLTDFKKLSAKGKKAITNLAKRKK